MESDAYVSDLRFLVQNATLSELQKHSGDTTMKKDRRPDQSIGIQGIILDAMDDGKVSPVQAHSILLELQWRIAATNTGISKVTKDGDLMPIKVGNGQ